MYYYIYIFNFLLNVVGILVNVTIKYT